MINKSNLIDFNNKLKALYIEKNNKTEEGQLTPNENIKLFLWISFQSIGFFFIGIFFFTLIYEEFIERESLLFFSLFFSSIIPHICYFNINKKNFYDDIFNKPNLSINKAFYLFLSSIRFISIYLLASFIFLFVSVAASMLLSIFFIIAIKLGVEEFLNYVLIVVLSITLLFSFKLSYEQFNKINIKKINKKELRLESIINDEINNINESIIKSITNLDELLLLKYFISDDKLQYIEYLISDIEKNIMKDSDVKNFDEYIKKVLSKRIISNNKLTIKNQ